MSDEIQNSLRAELIEQTVRKYADMIFRLAYQNLKNYSDAEDILQEVSVALITKNAPLGDPEHLRSWIVRVTLNKCKDFHKAFWRRNTEPIDDHLELIAPEQQEVLEELFSLPDNYRLIIYLYYYEAFTISEIADLLGKSPNTVSSSLQRARKKLKKLLTEGGFKYE